MKLCKVMLAQAKCMNLTRSTANRAGTFHVRFQGAKKRPAKGEELNTLVANAVKAFLTTNKHKKSKVSSDYVSED